MNESGPVISLDRATKRFGERCAVDGVSFQVPQGGVVGLVGPNGAGKTTVIRMLLGLARLDDGSVQLLGSSPGTAGYPAALRRVGALVEGPALYRNVSGRINLRLQRTALGLPDDDRYIDDLLELVGLAGRGDDRVREYSLGMRQRLGVAVALAGAPRLLILDEPTNGLDPSGTVDIRRLVRTLAERDITVLVSSHLLSEIELMSDTVVVMNHGRLVYQGPLDSLVSDLGGGGWELQVQPRHRQRAEEVLIRQGLAVTTLNESAVRIACDPDLTASALMNLVAVAGLDVTDITRAKPTLERAFLALTAAENR